ncbi:MAG: septal ring lytic transglycosylase RlpA family protein [Alphaproteobacteria bacterium]|nr:septal ring lytic transglycosylase RlpA family protein [Alphaproteobacteria bacterium]
MRSFFLLSVFALLLTGCSAIEVAVDLAKKSRGSSGTVVAEPRYKIGNPYEVKGIWYYPERNLNYDETGIASWYGDEFAGKLTANGEIFDPEVVSAAHKTLPMPSAVRVINLENGRSLVVRINDRGPFVSGRIIDLSREAARLLGFKKQGIARVRVQILAEESLRLEREAKEGRFPSLGQNVSALPETTAAAVPSVSLTSKGKVKKKKTETVSAIDLISSNRTTEIIELAPVDTNIFIQVGAFGELSNAEVVKSKVNGVGNVNISSFDDDGKLIHRVRIGPVQNVADADEILLDVIRRGFNSAKIVLE